jgi:hypothetical protein
MPRFPTKGSRLLLAILLLSCAFAAQSSKVTPGSFEKAQAAVAAARAEQAEHYAPVELRMAEESLALATAGIERTRRDVNVPRAIELALVQGELARARSVGAQLREEVAARERELDALERELLGPEAPR